MTTQQMTAQTMSMTLDTSRSIRAARSLAAAERISDARARFAALDRHMREFPPLIAS